MPFPVVVTVEAQNIYIIVTRVGFEILLLICAKPSAGRIRVQKVVHILNIPQIFHSVPV
ncbi:hypothetical protein D3C74_436660 [compost metagenome]